MMKLLMFMLFMMMILNKCMWYMLVMMFMMMMMYLISFFSFNGFYSMLSYSLGCDLLSLSLILLTIWIIIMMMMASINIYKNSYYILEFKYLIMFMLGFLLMTFIVSNLFMYYIFFECSLIPTLILIFGWGYQPERLMAGYYLLFYTLFYSLPMLLGIFYINNSVMSVFYFFKSIDFGLFIYLSMIMAFLVKMPMVFIHFWLPKAHVEAPVSGSMILAGVLLKLGGYGLLRVMYMFKYCLYNDIIIIISMFGSVMVGFLCLFQMDMKLLIAYSSVSHMGLVICGIFTLNTWGLMGSLVLMIGHGLCSSGLFYLSGIVYDRSGSRSLLINKGYLNYMPNMSMFWFLLLVNNMASPPSLNLLGEIMLINSLVSWNTWLCGFLLFMSFMSCLYSVYLYSMINHGLMYKGLYSMPNGYYIEYYCLFLHWLPLNMLVLKVDIFSMMI